MVTNSSTATYTFRYPGEVEQPLCEDLHHLDITADRLVRALECRGWNVPDFTVSFHTYGTGAAKLRHVAKIVHGTTVIEFGRPQARVGRDLNDTAGFQSCSTERQRCMVFDSGEATLWIPRHVAREPRTGIRSHVRLPRAGRPTPPPFEYRLRGSRFMRTDVPARPRHRSAIVPTYDWYTVKATMLHEMRTLTEMVEQTEATGIDPHYFNDHEETIPWPVGMTLITHARMREIERIERGQRNAERLAPDDRYALLPARTILPRASETDDAQIPAQARAFARWCRFGILQPDQSAWNLAIGEAFPGLSDDYLVQIVPRSANDIYVVDQAAYDATHAARFLGKPDGYLLTNDELATADQARARTLVPITQYDGRFKDPLVLIMRELAFDEIRQISGPWGRNGLRS